MQDKAFSKEEYICIQWLCVAVALDKENNSCQQLKQTGHNTVFNMNKTIIVQIHLNSILYYYTIIV